MALTAEHLHSEAVGANIRVSLATVYNTLHQLTKVGLLREVVVEPGRVYFDTNISDHHHFFHVDEGRLQDVDADCVTMAALPAPPGGTEIERVDVVIRCRKQ